VVRTRCATPCGHSRVPRSPPTSQLNRDAFVLDEAESTMLLEEHRGDSNLTNVDLGEADATEA
jgi:hypothetical protein